MCLHALARVQMFPRHVIEHMLGDPNLLSSDVGRMANEHPMVTVLFCDVVGFTSMSRHISPAQVRVAPWHKSHDCLVF